MNSSSQTPETPVTAETPQKTDASATEAVAPHLNRRLILGGVALGGLAAGGVFSWMKNRPTADHSLDLQQLWGSSFEYPNGDTVDWSKFKGNPLIINFWATWCTPCVEEMPLIDRFYKENAAKGWQVVGLAVDQPSRVRSFLAQSPVSYPILLAGMGGTQLTQALGNKSGALPFTIILDAKEGVLLKKLGKLKEEELSSLV